MESECTKHLRRNDKTFLALNAAARASRAPSWRNLDSVFYIVDFAELEDGTWKIIETGDGSVSGLSDGQDARSFFRKLYVCGN